MYFNTYIEYRLGSVLVTDNRKEKEMLLYLEHITGERHFTDISSEILHY